MQTVSMQIYFNISILWQTYSTTGLVSLLMAEIAENNFFLS